MVKADGELVSGAEGDVFWATREELLSGSYPEYNARVLARLDALLWCILGGSRDPYTALGRMMRAQYAAGRIQGLTEAAELASKISQPYNWRDYVDGVASGAQHVGTRIASALRSMAKTEESR